MNRVSCPSCGKSLPTSANYCALCGVLMTSAKQASLQGEHVIPQHAFATVEVQQAGNSYNTDDIDDMLSPTVSYIPPTIPLVRLYATKGLSARSPISQRLSDPQLPKTDPPIWESDEEHEEQNGSNEQDDEQLYNGTWHKELAAPSLHLRELPAPRPSSPHPVVLLKPRFGRRQQYGLPKLLFWVSVLVLLILSGTFGFVMIWGHGLFSRAGAQMPTLSLSQRTLGIGEIMTLNGSHFTPNKLVGLTRDSSIPVRDTHLKSEIRADAQGNFSDTIVILPDWQAGSHTMNAEDAVRHKIARVSLFITGTSGSLRPPHFLLSQQTLDMGIGDPATSSKQVVTLTNTGGGQFNWNAASSQSWLLLSPTEGTLYSGQATQVTIAVDRTGLAPGTYSGKILFSSSAGTNTLSVRMQVIPLNVMASGVLGVTPAVLSFSSTDGASAPAAQIVTVSNLGTQPLQWGVTSDQSWLSASPVVGTIQSGSSGASTTSPTLTGTTSQSALGNMAANARQSAQGASQSVLVSVNTSTMLPGTYGGTLTFTQQEAHGQFGNSTQSITVSLTIEPQCTIQVAPSLLTFTTVYQQSAPTAKAMNVTTSQGCTSPMSWSVTSGASWLSVNNSNGTTPASPQVRVNPAGLAPGTYNSSLVFTTSSGTQTLPVTLTIGQAAMPALSLSVSTLTYNTVAGSASPAAQSANISNSGGGTLSWQASAATSVGGNWLMVSPASGSLNANSSGGLSISTALLNGLVPGTYSGTVTITGTDGSGHTAAGSPQVIQVNFVVAAPCSATALPTTLSFAGVSGQTSVTPQSVTLTANGACANSLSWNAAASKSWLVPTATGTFSPSNAGTISVGASLAGLTPGTYSATLTVTVTDSVTHAAIGTPQSVAATLTVQMPCTLSAPSKSSLTYSAEAGQSAGTQTFSMNVSGSCVGNVTITPSVTLSAGTGWLSITPASASIVSGGSATFSVTASAVSLSAGSYTASISLSSVNGSAAIAGSPQVVGARFTVSAAPVLAAGAGAAVIHGTGGVTSQPVVITNAGGSTMNWTTTLASGTPSFFSLSATSGSLGAGANASVDIVADPATMTSGTYTVNVVVAATDAISGTVASGSPATVPINVTVSPPSLQVSTTSLTYSVNEGNNARPQSVTITNGGGGTLTWSIGSLSASWLSVKPTSGSDASGQSTLVKFAVQSANLAAGTYTATAVVTPSVGQAVTITATLTVVAPTPTPTPTTPPTPTPTVGITPGITATVGVTPTATAGITPTATLGVTPTATAGITPTATAGVTPTATAGVTPTAKTKDSTITLLSPSYIAKPPAKPQTM